ncbi:MAG: AAA family ATPase, partial [Clostridia bacterium]|nr:AAA family ATPase [Clostridia bacterium]
KIEKIVKSYSQNKELRNIVSFLSPFGITLNKAVKIKEKFGDKTLEVINETPFELCEISGFGFKTVDNIARKLKCKPNDTARIKAAAKYILSEAGAEGNVFIDQQELRDKCSELLNDGFDTVVVKNEEIRNAIIDSIRLNEIVNNNCHIYHPYMFKAEVNLAKLILIRSCLKSNIKGDVNKTVSLSQKKLGITLSETQENAVKTSLENNISVITGGPGTGKTTILKVIIEAYKRLSGRDDILLAAPTGRAAKRMAESTGIYSAKTIHSALGLFSDDCEASNGIDEGLIIIDEMSMVDLKLAYKLINSIKGDSIVVLVGDADQLPSVGAGNVFADIISSGCVACTRLDTVFRQNGTSRIALNAEKIRCDDSKLLYGPDFDFIQTDTENDTLGVVKQCYFDEIKKYGLGDVQILAPFRARGEISVKNINEVVREIINPFVGERNELFCDGKKLRLHDKVIQTKNKDAVNNGDIGIIKSIYEDDGDKNAIIEFFDGMKMDYSERDLDIIELAYATTIHKSQGSEYSCVIIPIRMSQYIMLKRNLVYTAITRAKEKVILVGEKRALMAAIHKNESGKRNSLLGERIKQYANEMKGTK